MSFKPSDVHPFLFGGVASCMAEAVTYPIDTAKTRLQLQGQTIDRRYQHRLYTGLFNCWKRIVQEEGVARLYHGLSPALLRQAVYGTAKYGLYYSIKDWIPGEESNVKNVACAIMAGGVSSAIANPTDVLKVRMQSQIALVKGSSLVEGFRDIYFKEGLKGLWRGMVPTAQRAAVVAGVQLPVYDFAKLFFLRNGLLDNDSSNHLISSFCAGLAACLVSSPVDVIRTRFMSQRCYETKIYKSSFQCGFMTVKNEGLRALYKGFVPAFMRMGPWNIIFFLVYEQLTRSFTQPPSSLIKKT
ncbi:kidney mitochondrial carrier protein 1-like [Tigriopus californicus]|uniref:kidney mitochondrial carrier protein 1-like n=1 Tax=Tigriopus californicus TaxID=6832 RepID=UPI0027D9E4C7|nr:kidney mitochondrial carrier protein 1-like [Tigriopus californicus]